MKQSSGDKSPLGNQTTVTHLNHSFFWNVLEKFLN